MAWLTAALREVFSLFVDDGAFAVLIVAWLLVTGLLLPRLAIGAGWQAGLLFVGLAVILLGSALRRAGRGG